MRLNRNSGLALLVVGLGILMLLNAIGFGLGYFMGFLIPIILLFLGYIGIKQGKSIIGWSLFIIGFIMLLGKFSGLLTFMIPIGIIVFGIFLMKKKEVQR